jgi:hypothetical protein
MSDRKLISIRTLKVRSPLSDDVCIIPVVEGRSDEDRVLYNIV